MHTSIQSRYCRCFLRTALLGLGALSTVPGIAQTTPQPARPATRYVIELTALGRGDESGVAAPQRFGRASFKVSHGSAKIPFQLLKSPEGKNAAGYEAPPHLLILRSATAKESPADLLGALQRLQQKGWLVSVAQPSAGMTSYSNDVASLAKVLHSSAVPTGSSAKPGPRWAPQEFDRALKSLDTYAGRRVVLYDGAPPLPLSQSVAVEKKKLAQVYLLDGGVSKTEYNTIDAVDASGAETSSAPVNTQETFRTHNYNAGIVHEPNPLQAVKDIERDQRNYYELAIDASSLGSAIADPIVITVNEMPQTDLQGSLYATAATPSEERLPVPPEVKFIVKPAR